MLETLTIKNIAVIDSAEIPFKSGLNILSGETGAGKSIIIEAIGLLLGGRTNTDLVRSGCDEGIVEGLFDISDIPWIKERLVRLGFPIEHSELLIKRTVHRNARHRIYVNGELATLSILHDLCEGLVDLCGQHEHQTLLKTTTQMELLDRYGGLTEQTKSFATALSHYRSLSREHSALLEAEGERAKKADYLKFQITELQEAQLQVGEDERLVEEKHLLQSAEQRIQAAETARQAFEDDEGVLNGLKTALSKLRQLALMDHRITPIREAAERSLVEAEDASLSLNRYLSTREVDPERLQMVQERLSLLADLRRKYGPTTQEMLETLSKLESELNQGNQISTRLQDVASELEKSEAELRRLAEKLSKARKNVAELLAKSVTTELHDLKMEEARFGVELSQKTELSSWGTSGADQIQFLVQTNRGDAARPLGKIASGGELSRLMLAIRRVIADRGGIGVYLFDEIDAGIGGQTAFQVGKKLKSVAAYNQVICITHLPQIASFAHHHLSVRKKTQKKNTATVIVELKNQERKEELARMLGGPELTKKSLENAAELIDLAL